MYEQFFGLRERPFDLAPDPRFLVMTEAHAEVLSTLEYAIGSRKGLTVLIGEAGLGKTTLLRAALDRQPDRVHFIYVQNPVLSRAEFVELLARRFGLSPEARTSKTALLFELEELLRHAREMGETTLLVVDEGQSLPPELLEEVRLLANIETAQDRLLSIIIAGQPELADRLNDPSLRQFKQRVALRCQLRPLTQDEVMSYLVGRVSAAGGVAGHVFTREAVNEIYVRSGGVPRTVSVIADNALLGGFAADSKPVTAAIVRDVCGDLDLADPVRRRNGHEAFVSESEEPARAVSALRSKLSLPQEPEATSVGASGTHQSGGTLFSAFSRKRRFFFFRG